MAQTETISSNLQLHGAFDGRRNIYDLSPEKLAALMEEWGEPVYRAKQVLHWLFKELVHDFSEMSNLPLALRQKLADNLRVGSAELVAQKISSDGWTRKELLRMRDGNTVEAVLMLYYDRATVCISSQVGCAMGCTFCATGQMGFTRNLSSGEIVEQVLWFNRWLRDHPHTPVAERGGRHIGQTTDDRRGTKDGSRRSVVGRRSSAVRGPDPDSWFSSHEERKGRQEPITAVTNIVFMGMGEPLVNYNNLWAAIRLLNSPQGLGIGARRMTVSTVGIAPVIGKFAREDLSVNLAVSLHAPNDEVRGSFMPINHRYPISELMAACRDYVDITHRRITFEYVLINGVNDSLAHAEELRSRLRGLLCHVNLIPLNPVPGTGMKATPREQVYAFQKTLEDEGIPTTVRIERGVDIAAACGQLKVEEEPGSKRRSLNPELVQAHVQSDLAAHA
jgi:23S rRNA (adenine2503-C2)-methyltransferase